MKLLKYSFILLLIAFLQFCETDSDSSNGTGSGSSSEEYTPSDQPLSGKYKGADWTFVSGKVEPDAFVSTKYSFKLYDTDIPDICDVFIPDGYEKMIMFSLPLEVGEADLKIGGIDNQSVTFYDTISSVNTIMTEGVISITAVNTDTVDAQIYAEYGDNTYIDGVFSVPLCSDN